MKLAIVGAAHQHVDYVLSEVTHRSELELVAAVEPNPRLRARYLNELNVPLYDDAEDLFARHEVDIALVAGVYSERAAASAVALKAGAHILADKPLCTSLEQLETIRYAAQTSDGQVSIMFAKRFTPEIIALRRLLAEGTLGKIAMVASTGPHELRRTSRPRWFLDRSTYGGIAGDLPIHDIDLVLTLIRDQDGLPPSGQISALAGNVRPDDHPSFDDHVALLMRAGNVPATIEASWLAPEASEVSNHYRLRVTGSEGTAEIDWAYNRVTVATHDRARWDEPLPPARRPVETLVDDLLVGRDPEVGTSASFLATEVALKAQFSAEHGGSVLSF